MSIVDFILNLAGLLLWLNWRSIRFDPLTKRLPATLMGTLRPATPARFRRWHLLAFMGLLLILRAAAYRWVAPLWVFKLHLGVVAPPFRSDNFGGMLLFSFLSFAVTLGIFYVVLLLLSLLKGPEEIHHYIRIPLGRMDSWSAPVKFLLPFVVAAMAWGLIDAGLGAMQVFPPANSMALRVEQSVVIALGVYLVWKFPIALLLVLHLLNSYVYFGQHPLWNYINTVAQKLLKPFRKIPLRAGRVDFAPLLGLVVLFLITIAAEKALMTLYRRLPV
jgi:uncharacterized protein YggT (Ycf19 family)